MGGSRGGGAYGPPPTQENHKVVGSILRKFGIEPPREAIGPGSNCLSREVGKALCEIRST